MVGKKNFKKNLTAVASSAVTLIAGIWRGKKLLTPLSHTTNPIRPTAVRVRKMLFDMLMAEKKLGKNWHGFRLLDLCAGVGTMGFEGLSRGANYLLLVEQNELAVKVLSANKTMLLADTKTSSFSTAKLVDILPVSLQEFWQMLEQGYAGNSACNNSIIRHVIQQPFDLIFADPPYQQPALVESILQHLAKFPLLKPNAWLVLEINRQQELPNNLTEHWLVQDVRSEGQAKIMFLQLKNSPV